jgi:DNA repair protein RadC
MIEGAISQPPAGGTAAAVSRMKTSDLVARVAMADHNGLHGVDVLEALLHMAEPGTNCRQIAERAMQTFGSVGGVLAAGIPELTSQLGIQERIAYSLRAIHVGMHCVVREPLRERVQIGSLTDLIDYLAHDPKERTAEILRVLYLDRKNGLISDEEIDSDTAASLPQCPRAIVRRALEHSVSAVIVVQHRPSRAPNPMQSDINCSQQLQHACTAMQILMHDYLVVGRSGHASLRNLGHL